MTSAITLTDAAIKHIQQRLENRGKGVGIRIKIKTTGCSGLSYVLEYVDQAEQDDDVISFTDELAVYIDPKSLVYIQGTQIDYQKQGVNEGLVFVNPNEKSKCGCGESFNI